MRSLGARIIIWLGAAILAVTAAFHFTGFASVKAAAAALESETLAAKALAPLWLFPTAHWFFIAVMAFAASFSSSKFARGFLGAAAVIIALDAGLLYYYLGPFIGEAMLAAAALCFALGAVFRRGGSPFDRSVVNE